MASKIKEKYGFYLKPETTELIDSHLELSQQKSRSAFVDEAIQHYCCYLDTDHNRVLGVEIIRVIRDTIVDQINRVAHMLFKIAVEMSVNNYLRASENPRLKEADYIRLREYAADQVRKTGDGFRSNPRLKIRISRISSDAESHRQMQILQFGSFGS